MITITQVRYKDSEQFGPDSHVEKIDDALVRLVKFELGYGGQVINIDFEASKSLVTVETFVMNCRDVTEFQGSSSDMAPLVHIASAHARLMATKYKSKMLEEVVAHVMEVTGGNPLLIKLGAGIIQGEVTLRYLMAALAGFDEDTTDRLSKMRVEDIAAVVTLVHQGDCDITTALQLAA